MRKKNILEQKDCQTYIDSIVWFLHILGNCSNNKQRFVRVLQVLFSLFAVKYVHFCTYFVIIFCIKQLHNSFARVS